MRDILKYAISLLFFTSIAYSQSKAENQLPVGAGVSLPSTTLNLVGLQNPTGLSKVNGHQLGVASFSESDTPEFDAVEADYTYGGGTWGLGLNYYDATLKASDTSTKYIGFGVGFDLGSFAIGFNSRQNANSDTSEALNATNLGLSFNPTGMHRIGAIVYNWSETTTADTSQEWAIGYAYVDSNFSFLIDYSSYKNSRQKLSPGFIYFNDSIQFSVTQESWQGETSSTDESTTIVALGLSFSNFHLGLYNNYLADTGVSLKAEF